MTIKKAQQAKNIVCLPDSDFPEIRCLQFFEEFTGYDVSCFYQIKDKENLFNLFVIERVKEILNGGFSILKPVENDFSHKDHVSI